MQSKNTKNSFTESKNFFFTIMLRYCVQIYKNYVLYTVLGGSTISAVPLKLRLKCRLFEDEVVSGQAALDRSWGRGAGRNTAAGRRVPVAFIFIFFLVLAAAVVLALLLFLDHHDLLLVLPLLVVVHHSSGDHPANEVVVAVVVVVCPHRRHLHLRRPHKRAVGGASTVDLLQGDHGRRRRRCLFGRNRGRGR